MCPPQTRFGTRLFSGFNKILCNWLDDLVQNVGTPWTLNATLRTESIEKAYKLYTFPYRADSEKVPSFETRAAAVDWEGQSVSFPFCRVLRRWKPVLEKDDEWEGGYMAPTHNKLEKCPLF